MKDPDEDRADVDVAIPAVVSENDDVGDDDTNVPPPAEGARPAAAAEPAAGQASMPEWVKISAGWWAEGALDDGAFLQSLQYLID